MPSNVVSYTMSNSREISIALATHQDNIDIALERRKNEGVLGIPSILAALQCLPEPVQETIGTLTHRTAIRLLLNQNVHQRLERELKGKPDALERFVKWLLRKTLHNDDEPETLDYEPLPTLRREAMWLLENLDKNSTTQCFMLAELAALNGVTPLSQELYRMGLQAAIDRAEGNPGEIIFQ